METIWDINNIQPFHESVLTVGTFDGIHIGHQQIIHELVVRAKKRDAKSMMITFEPHPGLVIGNKNNGIPLNLLTSMEEKIAILENLDLDRLIVTNFTSAFASMTAEEFVKDFLIKKLNMREMVIGHDHYFGKDRKGNIALLQEMGKELGFNVDALGPVMNDDDIVSSTLIRKCLAEGNVKRASELIGREYSISGQVVKGDGRGKTLGYPTANIKPFLQYKLVPKEGVYATRIRIGEKLLNAVTYVGPRPTFNLSKKVIEAHIYDFDEDIYNQHIELYFTHYIRNDIKFKSAEEMLPQIKNDKETAFEILKHM